MISSKECLQKLPSWQLGGWAPASTQLQAQQHLQAFLVADVRLKPKESMYGLCIRQVSNATAVWQVAFP